VAVIAPLAGLVALAAATLAASTPGRASHVIPLEDFSLGFSDVFAPATPEATVRRIARVLRNDLDLPLPDRITLRLYGSSAALEQGLVHDMGLAPGVAAEIGSFAAGVAFSQELLLLESESRRGAREWRRLVAHELTHLAQIELAGGEGRAAQWLAEGMAEWVAFDVVRRFESAGPPAEPALLEAVQAHLHPPEAHLDFEGLDDPRMFYDLGRRHGMVSTYRLSLALTQRLIARHGLPRVVAYFRAFDAQRDRGANFERAFGQSAADFATQALLPAPLAP
jgi:hypothetical protein